MKNDNDKAEYFCFQFILTLTVAAVSYATPLQPDNNLVSHLVNQGSSSGGEISRSADTTEHHRTRRSINGCPYQVEVKYSTATATAGVSGFGFSVSVTGDDYDPNRGPYKLLREYYETYTIQSGTFDGRDWYLSSSGHAIWYKGGRWRVGTEGSKGTTGGVFYTKEDDKCPHQTGFDWKYYVPAINEWVDADSGMYILTAS